MCDRDAASSYGVTIEQKKLPVLVVDDDEPTQSLLRAILKRHGYPTETAANGREAIECLREGRYAAVVLDMMLPEVDGRAVVEFLRSASNPVPVIICSAAGPTQVTGLDPAVVRAIIRKPFDIDEFVAAVTAVAGRDDAPPTRVLIVDDDDIARYTLRAFLDTADVVEAQSGDAALELIPHAAPDVVLLDLILPGTPGEEILRELAEREATRDLPVVVVTSRTLEEDAKQRLLRWAAAVVSKRDLSRQTLREALERASAKRRPA